MALILIKVRVLVSFGSRNIIIDDGHVSNKARNVFGVAFCIHNLPAPNFFDRMAGRCCNVVGVDHMVLGNAKCKMVEWDYGKYLE